MTSFLPRLVLTVLLIACLTAEAVATEIYGQLPRRGFLGVNLGSDDENRVVITGLVPGGSASGSELEPGDVLLAVGGQPVRFGPSLGAALRDYRAGDHVVLTVLRKEGEEEADVEIRLRPLGLEKSDELDLIYDTVPVNGQLLRSILSKPRGRTEPTPAILFIQGLSCASIEESLREPSTVLQLIHEWTRAGFVVMRCEKSGIGDSQGDPCADIGFDQEVEGFLAALRKLKTYDFVDPENVFVFGHSMGGIQGPVIVAEEPVKGLLVYGTGVLPWGEYLVENTRRQTLLSGAQDPAELETGLRLMTRFNHYLLDEKQTVDEIATAHEDLRGIVQEHYPDGEHAFSRHVRFFQELHARNLSETWSHVDCPVLAMYGEYDYATSAWDHERIADIVNFYHPGNGEWVEVPGVFHAFNERESMEQALQDPWSGPLGEEVVAKTLEWMRARMETADGS